MKKFILLVCILFISGCTTSDKDSVIEDNTIGDNNVIVEEPVEEYKDNNDVKLGLFLYDNNYRNKERIEDTYYADFITGTDIGSFEVFLTDDKVIDGVNFKNAADDFFKAFPRRATRFMDCQWFI